MTMYWLAFRISEQSIGDTEAEQRRDGLYEAVRVLASKWWIEPSSFILFESKSPIDDIAAHCRMAIAEEDLVLISTLDSQEARVLGTVDDGDLMSLMPQLTRP